ncbi:PUA domain-containing protein [Candidatus Hecatella orcuttiae]|jgi:predicted RNA-binding protein (TIGR00451 family)|uniref:PUA domain-containing protein n=1 Tax=Candidatus Hecatella orcuttiae TaxID=1935119 RepID=UPI002867C50F|nr:PUA domain-containing protein [Candidatus Hecatella orcuttiae]
MPEDALQKIRSIANYQFSRGAGKALFPEGVTIRHSKRTGKVREVIWKGRLLASLRATSGTFALTLEGFKRLLEAFKPPRFRVTVQNDVAELIRQGRTVFAKHVKDADPAIRPQDEVAVVDEDGELLAVGKALLSGVEMVAFQCGKAVRVRRGRGQTA